MARIVALSRHKTELNTGIRRDRTRPITGPAKRSRSAAGSNQKELAAVAAAAKEANELIEQRTFSWTALFNQLEATLPEDVMLTSVHPEFKDGETQVNLDVQGREQRRHRRVLGSPREDRLVPRRSSGAPQRHRGRLAQDDDGGLHADRRACGRAPSTPRGAGAMNAGPRHGREAPPDPCRSRSRLVANVAPLRAAWSSRSDARWRAPKSEAQVQREAAAAAPAQDYLLGEGDRFGQAAGRLGAAEVLQGRPARRRQAPRAS